MANPSRRPPARHRLLLGSLLLAALVALSGCGQKGPLTRPSGLTEHTHAA